MHKKISICIPTYNRAEVLGRCLQSVVGQPGDDLEILIQENCSPDDTRKVVDSFSDSRIRYRRNKSNIGGTKNVIDIFEQAVGDYVLYLTDDDYLLPGGLNLIRDFIDKGVECFTTDAIMYLERQKVAYNYSYLQSSRIAEGEDLELISKVFLSSHILSRCCFKKDRVDMTLIKRNAENMYPHMLMVLTCIAGGARLGYLAQPTVLHTWENPLDWEVDSSDTETLNGDIALTLLAVYDGMNPVSWEYLAFEFAKQYRYTPLALKGKFTASRFYELRRMVLKLERNKRITDQLMRLGRWAKSVLGS